MRLQPRWARALRVALVLLLTGYGALLRLDAISAKYDPVKSPRWLRHVEQWRSGPSLLRPGEVRWDPYPRFAHKDGPASQYRSDPYTYLQYARDMRSFYAAHRREPLFPAATKLWLVLLGDDDSAVSFASAMFSTLAIPLIVLVGIEAFSFRAGVAAAALWAIEYDVLSWGTEGWRDEAFTCALLLVAWSALRFDRMRSTRNALVLGVAMGAACLVRITALSFVVPALAWLAATGGGAWRPRLRAIGIAAVAALAVAGPFLFNCWREYGDPFYAINVHAGVYRAAEGERSAGGESAAGYVAARLRTRPVETVDTFVLGLTQYPFANKWRGFDPWGRWLRRVLAPAAIAGLVLFAATREGRALLVLLLSSLLPYAVTWRLIADWRFTEHAYPFLLLAACAVPWMASRAPAVVKQVRAGDAGMRRAAIGVGAWAAALCLAWIVFTRVTPPIVFREMLANGDEVTIAAGSRDTRFFAEGWPRLQHSPPVVTRVARGTRATIRIPLPDARDYDALVRVDPSTEPLRPGEIPAPIQLLLNGRLIGVCHSGSAPARMGFCRLRLPADGVRPGMNRLTLVTDEPNGFRVSLVRVTRAAS